MKSRRLMLVRRFLRGNKKWFVWSIVFLVLSISIDLLTPIFLMFVTDSVLGTQPIGLPQPFLGWAEAAGGRAYFIDNLWVLGVILVAINLVSGLLMFIRSRFTAIAGENIAKRMRDDLYQHLQRLDFDYHVKAETGDLIQRCSSDVETVRRFLSGQVVEMGRAVILVTLSLIVLLPRSVPLTLYSVCITPLIFGFSMFMFKFVVSRFKTADEADGAMSATLQESVSGMRVVRAFGRQRFEMDKFDKKSREVREGWQKLGRVNSFYWSMGDLLSAMQTAVTLGAGIYFAASGRITVGVMLLFMQYSGRLIWPVRQLGRILSELGRAQVALDRIDEILVKKPEQDDDGDLTPPIDREIVFEDVSFHYTSSQPVLNNINLRIAPGKTVALLGPTGSGKSSLMLLLQRLYEPQSGRITIGGADLQRIKKKYLRERVGIVLQEPFLYSRSIRANIAMARDDVKEEEIIDASRTAHADPFIMEFDKGYDTAVGERGVTLSGGQKQRTAIARTLVKQSDILIFDDSLSAVDTETDAAIRKALRERRKGITTFIISHRISTLQEADVILVIEDGRITQQGVHDELIRQEGLYKRINDIQGILEEEYQREADQPQGGDPYAIS